MKKSNFKVFFKKLPDDYLFESMIIFFIFFGAIPETHIPRDIKFNLSSVPAQCGSSVNQEKLAAKNLKWANNATNLRGDDEVIRDLYKSNTLT